MFRWKCMAALSDANTTQLRPASAYQILVVEDSEVFQTAVTLMLKEAGYIVSVASTGEKGLQRLEGMSPDLVILDLGLPGIGGMEVCERIRATSDSNIVMFTGRRDDESRFAGLEIGADAYVTKPFEPRELLIPIRVLLRRRVPNLERSNVVELGCVRFDRNSRQVWVEGAEVRVTKIEAAILDVLAVNGGQVVTRQQLIEAVWGPNWVGDDHIISVHIANLRKKVSTDQYRPITTLRGVGYRFEVPAS